MQARTFLRYAIKDIVFKVISINKKLLGHSFSSLYMLVHIGIFVLWVNNERLFWSPCWQPVPGKNPNSDILDGQLTICCSSESGGIPAKV